MAEINYKPQMQAGIASLSPGRLIRGPGDGTSDSIPAHINGEPAALGDGEYVLPAQVVSALGNGSTEAGARLLDEFVKRVYAAQTGSPNQAPRISMAAITKGM